MAAGEGGSDRPSDPEGDVGEHQEEGRRPAVRPLAQVLVPGAWRHGRVRPAAQTAANQTAGRALNSFMRRSR